MDAPGTDSGPERLTRAADMSGKLLVIAAAVVLGLILFWSLRSILLPIFLALLISTQLMPLVNWLKSKGVPAALAVLMTVLFALLVFAGVATLIVGQVVSASAGIGQSISAGTDDLARWVAANSGPLDLTESQIKAEAESLAAGITENPGSAAGGVVGGLSAAAGLMIGVLLTLAFTIYMLSDGGRSFTWFLDRLRKSSREKVYRAGERAWTTMGGYVRGVATVAVVDAALIGAVLFLLGVPLAGALTAMIFLLAFIPILGAWVSGIIATLVALADGGVAPAAAVAVTSLVVQQFESLVVAPMVYRRVVSLNPMITLAAVASGALLAGVIGAFIAVPLVAVAWAVTEEWNSADTLRA